MMTSSTLRTFCAVTVGTLLLAGCDVMPGGDNGMNGDMGNGMGNGDTTRSFDATLTGDQEVPAVDTEGTGTGDFMLDEQSGVMSYSVMFAGLSGPVTAAHFHEAPPGENGGIIIDLTGDFTGDDDGFVQGTATFTEAQIAALGDGNVYINLHTEENPGGEIRGQLVEEE